MRCIMRENLSPSKPEMTPFTESIVEQAALAWLESLGWCVRHGLEIAPGKRGAERVNGASRRFTPSTDAGAPA